MSDYDDGPRRYRSARTRPRERDDPEYVQETTYVERGKGPPPKDLVYRRRDDSVESIPRDFPPPGADRYRRDDRHYDDRYRDDRRRDYRDDRYDDRPPRRARSASGRHSRYDDDRYSDYDVPAAAGVAGYAAGRAREKERRRRHRDSDSDSPSPPRKDKDDRRKSGVGDMLEGLGLGGIAGAILGKEKSKGNRSPSRDRGGKDRDGRRDSGRSRRRDGSSSDREGGKGKDGKDGKTERKWAQAAQAALVAGAVEAFRSRKEPGPWTGAKGRRIATAALGAGGIDGLVDRDPDKKSKRHLAEAVIGGLAANRIANGPRDRGRSADPGGRGEGRSRSIFGRSQSRGREKDGGGGGGGGGGGDALKGLAAGGALAAAGKAIYDRVRSKSRKRRSPSASSTDSYEPPSRNRRPRGGRGDDTRSRTSDTTNGDRARGNPGTNMIPAAGVGAGAGALAARNGGPGGGPGSGPGTSHVRSSSVGSASSSSLEDVEKKRKHMRGKELITAGLATIATIHAAHGVYSSMEAHEKRHKLVQEGEMSPEEARKKQTKAWVQDAAAVGIAALGIKGAFSEWKEMNEHRHEIHELAKRKREKAKRKEKREKLRQQQFQMQQMQMMNPMMWQMMQQQNGQGQGQGQQGYGSQDGGYRGGYREEDLPPPPPGPPPRNRY